MIRFFVLFSVLVIVLFSLELTHPVEQAFVLPFTAVLADISAWLIQLFDPNVAVNANAIHTADGSFGIRIVRGCNGLEAVIILFAGIFAFPAPWKHKLIGFGIGFLAIQALNLVRIISLFYLGQWSRAAFDFFHLYLWQALIILDALVVWLIWLRKLPRPESTQPDSLSTA